MIYETTEYGVLFQIPVQFGNYEYASTIGRGGSSVVVAVIHKKTNIKYAAKVISRQAISDQHQMEYLERELRLMSTFNHPNILKIVDEIYLKDVIIVVTEYCVNGDLLSFMLVNAFTISSMSKKIFVQIVEAVHYLHHHKKISHRDLKPENILVDQDMTIKIGDFGLSKIVKDGELFSTLCGTFFYLAPELITQSEYDAMKCDIWALGIILYIIICGSLPWKNLNNQQLLMNEICSANIIFPSDMNSDIVNIIKSCTEIDPNKRPTAEEILNFPWLKAEALRYQNQKLNSEVISPLGISVCPLSFSSAYGSKCNIGKIPQFSQIQQIQMQQIQQQQQQQQQQLQPLSSARRTLSCAGKNILRQPILSYNSEKRKSGQFLLNIKKTSY